jgi:hypothetical protein
MVQGQESTPMLSRQQYCILCLLKCVLKRPTHTTNKFRHVVAFVETVRNGFQSAGVKWWVALLNIVRFVKVCIEQK